MQMVKYYNLRKYLDITAVRIAFTAEARSGTEPALSGTTHTWE